MLPWLCCCSSSTKGRALTWECCAHRLRWLAPFSWQRVTVQMRELCTACFPSFGVQCFILCHTVCSPSDLEVWKLQALIAFSLELVAGLSWEPGVILSECWLFLLFLAASVSSVLKTSCFFCFFFHRRNHNHIWQVLMYARTVFYKINTMEPLNPEAAVLWVPLPPSALNCWCAVIWQECFLDRLVYLAWLF